MIKFKAEKIEYNCPTSWGEITFKQWKGINKTKDTNKIFSVLTGLPLEKLNRLSENSLNKLTLAIGFVLKPIKIKDYETHSEISYKQNIKIPFIKNISEKSYGQKIYLQHLLFEKENKESKIIEESILIYAQPYIDKTDFNLDRLIELKNSLDNLLFVDLYSIAIDYATQLKELVAIERRELNVEPTYEQRTAGVDMFSKFGVMNTVKALANNNVLNYEKVLNIEYNTVFIHLLMSKTENIYQDNYRKVLEQKNKNKRR